MPIKRKLIIMQSPADMADGLLILNSINSSEVEVGVIGSMGLFNSMKLYHSKVILLSPPALSKGFFRYIFWFIRNKNKNINFVNSYDEIFYPDLLNDVLSSVLIKIAKNKNIPIIKYVSRYDVLLSNEISNASVLTRVKSKILSAVLNTISGLKEFKMVKYNDRFIPYCTIEPDRFLSLNKKIIQKKDINIKLAKNSKPNFLFLDPGPGVHDALENYFEVIPPVLKKLSLKGNLYIKKHPTHSLSLDSWILHDLEFSYFEENLPISMMNLNGFYRVIAIDSIGLTEVEGSIPISIIKLFRSKKQNYMEIYINYMSINSSKEILFPEDECSFDRVVSYSHNVKIYTH